MTPPSKYLQQTNMRDIETSVFMSRFNSLQAPSVTHCLELCWLSSYFIQQTILALLQKISGFGIKDFQYLISTEIFKAVCSTLNWRIDQCFKFTLIFHTSWLQNENWEWILPHACTQSPGAYHPATDLFSN